MRHAWMMHRIWKFIVLPPHGAPPAQAKDLTRRQGSTLVAAIFFALIFAVSGVTYLLVIRNSGQQENDAQREYRALYAAESGLLVGTRLLSQSGLPDTPMWVIPQNARIQLNQLWVDVEVVDISSSSFWSVSSSGTALKAKKLNSRAYDAQIGGRFIKRVSWLVNELAAFDYGYFSNGLSNNGEGELCGNRYFGSAYLTARSSANPLNPVCNHAPLGCSRYYGRVSLSGSHINTSGNHCQYDSTEIMNGETPLYTLLQSPILVPDAYKYMANNIRTAPLANKVLLSGKGTLIFGADSSATFAGITYKPIAGLIFVANNDINVEGTVKGEATVVSGAGKKITISNNLVYASLSSSAAAPPSPPTSIASGSTDYLGIVSDGGVVVDNAAPRQVSAAIVAWRDGGTGLERTNASNKITLTGTLLQDKSSKDFYPMDFVHDIRMKTHAPPGFPPLGMVDNLYKFEIRNWEESSVN